MRSAHEAWVVLITEKGDDLRHAGCDFPAERWHLNVSVIVDIANAVCCSIPAYRTYTVEWTGTGANERFEIDLYYCGSNCSEVRIIEPAEPLRGIARSFVRLS